MRIGIDVRALQTQGGSATRGIGRYVTDLVEGLLTFSEEKIVLLSLEGRDVPRDWGKRCEVVPVEGLIYHEMPKPLYMKIPKVRSSQALLGRLHDRAVASQRVGLQKAVGRAKLHVLHLPNAVDVGSYPEGDWDVPTVMTFLDAIPLVHRELYYDVWGRFLQRFYDRQLANLQKAACVVAISEASRQDAIRFGRVAPEKVRVVYPSIAPAFFEPPSTTRVDEVKGRFGIDRPYVLFCSVPDPHKNPDRVVEGFARANVEGTQLVFVSPREEPHLGHLQRLGVQHNLEENRLIVTGRVSDSDLVALFQGASVLASPSLVEGFGLPAAQSLAVGTPTIVSSRGSQPEVVGDAGLVVDPEDSVAISDAIRSLITNAPLRESLIAKGREQAKRFAPERQAGELMQIYHEVAK